MVILFSPLLDEPAGPRGINYQGLVPNPEPQDREEGGGGDGRSVGMIPSGPDRAASTERHRGRSRKGSDREKGGAPSVLAYKPQLKELFHTRPNTCCHWQM